MAARPTIEGLRAWLSLDADDHMDDPALQASIDAALDAQAMVVRYPVDAFNAPSFSDDLVEAVYLRAQRLLARRSSPEGVVGLSGVGGDFVAARVPTYDADVAALEGPYRTIPVA